MQVYDVIEQAQSGQAMANLGATFGITEGQARVVAQAVLPELALGLERNTLSRGGLADLVTALGQGHHEQILETPRAWTDPRVTADGQAILGHILGSEHNARVLTARAAKASGLGESIVQMLLPILAQLLMGAIARYAKGGLGDILSRLPIPGGGGSGGAGGGWPQPQQQPSGRSGGGFPGGGGFELPRSELPPSGGYPMPPMPPSPDGGGVEVDARGGGGNPFPLPGPGGGGGNNPYGDLSDILRRRGGGTTAAVGGGGLARMIRGLLGGVLGFGGRGIFGWIIRLLVVRYGWSFLQRILGRVLLRR